MIYFRTLLLLNKSLAYRSRSLKVHVFGLLLAPRVGLRRHARPRGKLVLLLRRSLSVHRSVVLLRSVQIEVYCETSDGNIGFEHFLDIKVSQYKHSWTYCENFHARHQNWARQTSPGMQIDMHGNTCVPELSHHDRLLILSAYEPRVHVCLTLMLCRSHN